MQGCGGDAWLVGQHLQRRNTAVAAKQRHEPGDTGREEQIPALERRQHLDVVEGSVEQPRKLRITGRNRRRADLLLARLRSLMPGRRSVDRVLLALAAWIIGWLLVGG